MTPEPTISATDARLGRLIGHLAIVSPPAGLHDRLLGMFRRPAPAGLRRRLVARLLGDAVPGAALAGARGAAGRQAVFSCELADLSLQIRVLPDGSRLDGMVLPADGNDREFSVRLEREGVEPVVLRTNGFGEFRVAGQPSGTVHLVVELDDLDMVAGPIELAA